MSGKGSAPRPFDVPREQYENNFDRIFRSKQETTPEPQCRTDGRCQYAIDVGAEGLGHCPKGKCIMPVQETTPEEDEAWLQMEQSPSGVHADVHEPVMATDLGELCLTAVDDVLQSDMLAELEQENRLLRARNERLEHRLRELGEEMP